MLGVVRMWSFMAGARRTLLEGAAFEGAVVHPEAVRVDLAVQKGNPSECLAAGAGGAGACLGTSFVQAGHDKVAARLRASPASELPLHAVGAGQAQVS
jgi:hypothetical protein